MNQRFAGLNCTFSLKKNSFQASASSPSLFLQLRLHGAVWDTRPEGVLGRTPASLPHSLHGRARLHQRHGDVHRVGQWQHAHRLGQKTLTQDARAGRDQHGGSELGCPAVASGQYGEGRALSHAPIPRRRKFSSQSKKSHFSTLPHCLCLLTDQKDFFFFLSVRVKLLMC